MLSCCASRGEPMVSFTRWLYGHCAQPGAKSDAAVDAARGDLVQLRADLRGMRERAEAVDVDAIARLVDLGAAIAETGQRVPLAVRRDAVLARLQQRQRIRELQLRLRASQLLHRAFRQHPGMRQRSTAVRGR